MHIMRIHNMEECLTEWAKAELDKGKECVCTDEMGKVVDMIKDLAKAEKDAYEAKYYKQIVESMEEYKEEEKCEKNSDPWYLRFLSDRAGYDNWRYSSGRFAPKGHGHRSGYMSPWPDPSMMGEDWENVRMGYPTVSQGSHLPSRSTGSMMQHDRSSARTPYENWQEARRHYSETHSPQDKSEMDEHAKEHLESSMASFRDIWREADPDMKRRMKNNLSALIGEMNV